MPDERNHGHGGSAAPSDWAEAFAALPQETPPDDGWSRIATRLPSRRRTRWPAWVAAAAVLAVLAVLPSKLLSPDAPAPERDTPPARPVATTPMETSPAEDATIDAGSMPSTEAREGGGDESASGTLARVAVSEASPATTVPARRSEASGAAARTVTATAAATTGATRAAASPAGTDAPGAELERLYAESAQLEALLAMVRDDRVASGTAMALASEYDAQLAAIDAALMQPGIAPDERTSLWRDRVAALRQVAAFESTRRMLAAQGERYDTMLVSID